MLQRWRSGRCRDRRASGLVGVAPRGPDWCFWPRHPRHIIQLKLTFARGTNTACDCWDPFLYVNDMQLTLQPCPILPFPTLLCLLFC